MTGNTVLQRFEITERLGAGGFGTVYRAWDNRLEREVAVKIIETGPDSGERVQREAQAAARLNHPGIVTLFEYDFQEHGRRDARGNAAGRAFLVSELVEGETVRVLVDRDNLSDRDVAEIGADICEALDHAHSRGVVHRDLKPANLIVEDRGGAAKLMDFGIARLTDGDDLTVTGDVLGTLAYMSPEQAEGRKVGPAGDVYSLCLTLYEAWSGENPRRRSTPTATARAFDEDLPSLSEFRGNLPQPLIDVIDAGLDQEPEYRPTVEEVGTVLEGSIRYLDDHPPVESRERKKVGVISTANDITRIAAAAGTAAMVATVLIVSGNADFVSVALLSVITALLSLLQPRIGFLFAGAATSAWLAFMGDMPGAALILAILVISPGLLVRGSGRALAISPLGPLLGALGLAPFLPCLAAVAENWRDRIVISAVGLLWTVLAEAATGRSLLFGTIPQAPSGWADSVSSSITNLLVPSVGTTTFALSLVVWVLFSLAVGTIVSAARNRRRGRGSHGWGGEGNAPLTPTGVERFPSLP